MRSHTAFRKKGLALAACKRASAPPCVAASVRMASAENLAAVVLTGDLAGLDTSTLHTLRGVQRACAAMDDLYRAQIVGEVQLSMAGTLLQPKAELARLLARHGGPWSRLRRYEPLAYGVPERPPGVGFYPLGTQAAEIEQVRRAGACAHGAC